MPDLRSRPTRYATSLVLVTALAAGTWTELDGRLGSALVSARTATEALAQELADAQREAGTARDQLAEAEEAAMAGASAGEDAVLLSGTGQPGSTANLALAATTRGSTGNATGCAAYPHQEAAQAAFAADRARLTALDGDADGKACEQLRTSATTPGKVPAEKSDPAGPAAGGTPAKPTPAPKPTTTPKPTSSPSSTAALRCDTYADQEAAQAAYNADPTRLAALDGDRDGKACEQLRSRVTPTVRITPPVSTPAYPSAPSKSQLLASGRYFGISAATTTEFTTLETNLDRQANITSTYQGWDTDFQPSRVVDAWRAGTVPMITWESRPLSTVDDGSVSYSLDRITDGHFDDYLVRYAQDLVDAGLPVVIRFNHEMNGDWYRWTEARAVGGGPNVYGNTSGDYVAAWKHVHDVFAAQGANDLVIWVWAPNRVDNISSSRFDPIAHYWPGDSYVDWVGMTGYYRPEDVDSNDPVTFTESYSRTLAKLRELTAKPILLAEVGATEKGNHKVAWVTSFFAGLAQQPDVVGFVWFNYAVSENGYTNDWRLNSTSAVFNAFEAGLHASLHGLDVGKSFSLQPIGATAAPPPTPTPTGSPTSTATGSPTSTTTGSPTSTSTSTSTSTGTATPSTPTTTPTTTSTTTPTTTPTPTPTPTPTTT